MLRAVATLTFIFLLPVPLGLHAMAEAIHESSAVSCQPPAVGMVVEKKFGRAWNQGSARIWNERGEFWSMPFPGKPEELAKLMQERLATQCRVLVAQEPGFSARIVPLAAEVAPPDQGPISNQGTTLGLFSSGPGETILLMYSAKIASGIARGYGVAKNAAFPITLAKISPHLDIEYNFGSIQVVTLGGIGKLSLGDAAHAVFQDLRDSGYQPMPKSIPEIVALDNFFSPERHESFWMRGGGLARVSLERIKNGQTKVDINETKESH